MPPARRTGRAVNYAEDPVVEARVIDMEEKVVELVGTVNKLQETIEGLHDVIDELRRQSRFLQGKVMESIMRNDELAPPPPPPPTSPVEFEFGSIIGSIPAVHNLESL